jgi:regulator-associated protein of mTOR
MSWNQYTGNVAVSGKSQFIRIWDVRSETKVQDMWTRSYSDVTSMAQLHDFGKEGISQDSGNKYAAGFRNGTVSILDSRLSYNNNTVISWSEHSGYVCWIHQQKGHSHQLVSGSSSGDVRFWDLRFQRQSVAVWTAHSNGGMTDLAVHDHAGILAT